MKKILIILGMFLISFTIAGCTQEGETVTEPTFNSFTIDGQSAVDGSNLVTFYKGKNEVVEVEVSINNPSNLLITSIKINGDNYRFSAYKTGTTANKIIFDLNVKSESKEIIFSIDEIKYEKNDTVHSVFIENNNEFKVFVYKDVPIVERSDFFIGQDYITVELLVNDIDGVIIPETFTIELFEVDNTLVYTDDISVESQTITIPDLDSATTYNLTVKATYNLGDNKGDQSKVLYGDPFVTFARSIPQASIIEPVLEGTMISFGVEYTDDDGVITEDGLRAVLYELDEFGEKVLPSLQSKPVNETTIDDLFFDGLDNNTNYEIVLVADYNLNDGSGTTIQDKSLNAYVFITDEKMKPVADINNLVIEENRVTFEVEVFDEDGVLTAGSLQAIISINGTEKKRTNITEEPVNFQIFNLYANEDFKIKIVGLIDLNDGLGEILFELHNEGYLTQDNAAPKVNVSDVVVTQGYVTVDLAVVDPNNTLYGDIVATLYDELGDPQTTVLLDATASEIVFRHLVNNLTRYTIEIRGNYDLRDGEDIEENALMYHYEIVPAEKKAPAVEIENGIIGKDFIEFDINLMDSDDTVVDGSLEVYLQYGSTKILPDIDLAGHYKFIDLYSTVEYNLVIVVDYNVTDNVADNVTQILTDRVLFNGMYTTLEKDMGTAVIDTDSFESDTDSITFDVLILDNDFVLVDDTYYVYILKDGIRVQDGLGEDIRVALDRGPNPNVTFGNLLSGNRYTFEIISNVNMQTNTVDTIEVLDTSSFTTTSKELPTGSIDVTAEEKEEITVDIEFDDIDNIRKLGSLYLRFYVSGEVAPAYEVLLNDTPGFNTYTIPLASDRRYRVQLEVQYDAKENVNPVLVNKVLAETFVDTNANEVPEGTISNVVFGKTNVTFDAEIIDVDGVIVPLSTVAVIYKDGLAFKTSPALSLGVNNVLFDELEAGSTYIIVLETDYNLRSTINGVELDEVVSVELDEIESLTEKLDAPTFNITVDEIYNIKVDFTVDVTDDDNTLVGATNLDPKEFVVKLYHGLNLVGQATLDTNDYSVINFAGLEFDGLEIGEEYDFIVEFYYDLNDGEDISDIQTFSAGTFTTAELVNILDFTESKLTSDFDPLFAISQPKVEFFVAADDQYSILTNESLTITVKKAGAFAGDTMTISGNSKVELFNLWFDTTYVVEVTANYTDLTGAVSKVVNTLEFTTGEMVMPEIAISNLVINGSDVIFDVMGVTDEDGVIILPSLRVEFFNVDVSTTIPENTFALGLGDSEDITFTDILLPYNGNFVIRIRSNIDLQDGEGLIENYLFFEGTFVYTTR